jgi:menaquinone-specific isochorismate synthase
LKAFWQDREGKAAPKNCTFYLRSFDSKTDIAFTPEFVELPQPKIYKAVKKNFFPDFDGWKAGVEKALDLIKKKEIEKVVLGRICVLEFEEVLDPFMVTAALKEKAEGAFVFCFELEGMSFLGASPERLFKRREKVLLSEALAGTRARGKDGAQDEILRKELLASFKDLREFSPVKKYLQRALSPLCINAPVFSPLSIHQTENVQHLYSGCTALLNEGSNDLEILQSLHPTPALCGTPTERAYSLIREIEPFDREFFGGAIGWATEESSEWIVAIRSCKIEGRTATLFTGTGIVEGSDAAEEWEELNQKLRLYDRILDH